MFIGLCGTFLHANSTVKRQVSLKVHGVYIFTTSVPVVDLRSNLWQFTSFTSFSFTLSLYILINIVACAYSYFEITAQSWYYTGG